MLGCPVPHLLPPELAHTTAAVDGVLASEPPNTAIISSQLRIQSILSPQEVDADDPTPLASASTNPASKRPYEDAFTPVGSDQTVADSPQPHPHDSPSLQHHPPPPPATAATAAPAPATAGRKPLVSSRGRTSGANDDYKPVLAGAMEHTPPPSQTHQIPSAAPASGLGSKSKMRPPMRSSIACLRCRKSKIKCDNDGGNSPCDTCIKTGKDCRYPEAPPSAPKRSAPVSDATSSTTVGAKPERDASGPGSSGGTGGGGGGGGDRKRFKRLDDLTKIENDRAPLFAEDALGHSFLTEELWDNLFNVYKLHFATELPFLHIPTLKEKIAYKLNGRNSSGRIDYDNSADDSTDTNLVLLGVLTLTARFHPGLVKYIANQVNPGQGSARSRPVHTKFEPTQASEYYAEVLTKSLGPLRIGMTVASVERVQAFLMLGLYEWTQSRPKTGSMGAWMYVGVAIRMAQALGLGFGDKPSPHNDGVANRVARGGSVAARHGRGGSRELEAFSDDVAIEKEIKRRTMFSCLILDRMMSCGKHRVSTIQSEDLQIQLPCSEDAFDLSKDVYTGFLKEQNSTPGRPITDDSVLSRFVRLVDIWGKISKFSFAGGRLTETLPPWDQDTTFYKLCAELTRFENELPHTFRLSKSNYFKHENHQASSVYVSLHMLMSVCQIMLHREYIPYIPIRCDRPDGPLDAPRFPANEFQIPAGFWEESAAHVFQAAKNIVCLIEMCQRKDNLPQSSLVVFSVWTAAFVGIYAYHFPHMDTHRNMLPEAQDLLPGATKGAGEIAHVGPTRLTYQALSKMSQLSKMATTYLNYFRRFNNYYDTVKRDYQRACAGVSSSNNPASSNPTDSRQAHKCSESIREGGGLEQWKNHSSAIINNGTILPDPSADPESKPELGLSDHQHGSPNMTSTSGASTVDDGQSSVNEYCAAPAGPNGDRRSAVRTPRSTPSLSFTPINTSASTSHQQQTAEQALSVMGSTGPWGAPNAPLPPQLPPQQVYDFGAPPPQQRPSFEEGGEDVSEMWHGFEGSRIADEVWDLSAFSKGDSSMDFRGFLDAATGVTSAVAW